MILGSKCAKHNFCETLYMFNRPFATEGHMVQNPRYWRAKECNKTPLGNVNKEKSLFYLIVFCFGVWHILLLSNILDFVPRDLQLQRAYLLA